MNIAIITASKDLTLLDKHVVEYAIEYAKKAKLLNIIGEAPSKQPGAVYVSTANDTIAEVAKKNEVHVLKRPANLDFGSVIKQTYDSIFGKEAIENIVFLQGNCVMYDAELIDFFIGELERNQECTSVISTFQAKNEHPLLALEETDEGYLKTPSFFESVSSPVHRMYYFDQSLMAFRAENLKSEKGPGPYWWLGEKCKPIARHWISGRDIKDDFDLHLSKIWHMNNNQTKE